MSDKPIPQTLAESYRRNYGDCLDREGELLKKLGAAEAKSDDYHRVLYDDLGCRESCMGWVNERAEIAEAALAEAQQAHRRHFERELWISDLQQQVTQQAATLSEMRQERDALREVTERIKRLWNEQVTQQAATISQLRAWVALYSEHRVTCTYEYGACDCGLDEALASAQKEKP